MTLELDYLHKLLYGGLCTEIRIHERSDGMLMLETPFTFPDGDRFPIYVSETPAGSVRLSDLGHTLMHISYHHDIDDFWDSGGASLLKQIVQDGGIDENGGIFSVETQPERLAETLLRFGQTITRIYDLTFLRFDPGSSKLLKT